MNILRKRRVIWAFLVLDGKGTDGMTPNTVPLSDTATTRGFRKRLKAKGHKALVRTGSPRRGQVIFKEIEVVTYENGQSARIIGLADDSTIDLVAA